ncbi:MAG TPA: hypothetical protein DIC35_04675 [Candidatus Moranbacteria bacterium]|nr:hypothetical protein [Candidatus Moranbacteria bacterium]
MANLQEPIETFGGFRFFEHLLRSKKIIPLETIIVIVERRGQAIGRFMVDGKGRFVHLDLDEQFFDPKELLELNRWRIENEPMKQNQG